jgi:type II secretory pathway component PulM
MIETLASWWRGLASREQRFITGGAAAIALVVAYLALWEPAATGTRKLDADLPQLRAQGATMRGMADEAVRLRGAGAAQTPVAPADREAAVRRSLDRAGLSRASAAPVIAPSGPVTTLSTGGVVVTSTSAPEIVAESNGRVRVRFANIDYGVWVGWLATAEIELAARASQVVVNALAPDGPVGHVKTDVILDWGASTSAASTPR